MNTAARRSTAELETGIALERLARVRKFAEQLVKSGAVMMVPGRRASPTVVARLSWRGRNTVSWFAAQARRGGPHRLSFDDLRGVPKHGVCFLRADHVIGYLSSAASAEPQPRALFAPVVSERRRSLR